VTLRVAFEQTIAQVDYGGTARAAAELRAALGVRDDVEVVDLSHPPGLCGPPGVAYRAAGVPEVAGDAAILACPGEPRALADGLRRVLGSLSARAGLRRRGLARAAELSWERTAGQTVRCYREALGS
jgi:glycosyltransferase involved in cell wall biosynthesis